MGARDGSGDWIDTLQSVERGVVKGEKAVCVLALVAMTLGVGLSVLSRNLDLPLPNTGEIGLAATMPLTLIGGALCTYLGSHIAVDLIRSAGPSWLRAAGEVGVAGATLVFAGFYIYSGWIVTVDFRASGDQLLDLGTPLWALSAFFPVGMTLMAFHASMRILSLAAGRAEPGEDPVT